MCLDLSDFLPKLSFEMKSRINFFHRVNSGYNQTTLNTIIYQLIEFYQLRNYQVRSYPVQN
jgi:hypothetical protein